MSKQNSKVKRFVVIFALGMIYGTMFNLPYMKYVFYDAMIEAMNTSNSNLGLLVSIYSIASVVALIPSGWLADKFSAKPLMVWSALIQGLATVWFAFNLTSMTVASIVWFISGIAGASILWTANLKAVRLSAPSEEQGQAYGLWEAMCGLSAMICNFIALWAFNRYATAELGASLGLQWTVISMAITNLVGAILVQLIYKDPEVTTSKKEEKNQEKRDSKKALSTLLRNPGLYLSGIMIFTTYGIFANQSFLTPFSTNVLGAAVTFAGGLAILRSYGLKLVGGPIGGWLGDKLKSASKLQIIAYIGIIVTLAGILMAPVGGANTVAIVTALMLILSTLCFVARGSMWATVDEANIPIELSGTAISIVSLIGFSGADIVLPPLFGAWIDKFGNQGYYYVIYGLIVLAVIGILAGVAMLSVKKKAANR